MIPRLQNNSFSLHNTRFICTYVLEHLTKSDMHKNYIYV